MSGPAEPVDPAATRRALHAPFRPRRARLVALIISTTEVLVLSVLALVLPGTGPEAFQWYDRLGVFLVGLAIGWGVLRFGKLAILPREDGLTVRNLVFTRELVWAEVVAVRFGGGGPWVTLDLADGDTLAAMAVQRADGPFGQAEARRLATLVALHSQTERDD